MSRFPEAVIVPLMPEDIKERMLEGLDEAFASCGPASFAQATISRHLKILETIDERIERSPATPLYSEDLAREFRVSVRTLHNLTMRLRGVSLHQYLRIRRLWMVRHRLLSGDPLLQVKSCAPAFGFWHQGEFSSAYSMQFGELPSQAHARARSRAA